MCVFGNKGEELDSVVLGEITYHLVNSGYCFVPFYVGKDSYSTYNVSL